MSSALSRIGGSTSWRRALWAAAAAGSLLGAAPAPDRLQFARTEGLNLNAFVQDGQVAAHLLLRSGKTPRILVAFPAGNSGVGLWFAPEADPVTWRLTGSPQPVVERDARGRPLYGVRAETEVRARSLTIGKAVLSSVRVLRDYQALGTVPSAVDAKPAFTADAVRWSRDRLDGAPGYGLAVRVLHGTRVGDRLVAGADGRLVLAITALSGEPPLTPFPAAGLLTARAAADPAARQSLRFLSYREKFLAGSWRFNTYFGRDTLLSLRLLMPALTPDAVETGLAAVLTRLSPAGEVAHEEDIGEFAILDHLKADRSRSDAPVYDYKMIDSSWLLAPVASAWLLDDPRAAGRARAFLAGADARPGGAARRRGDELVANLRLVLRLARPFADDPRAANLLALKPGVPVGEWRDSNTGLGGGRIPYDVNAVLAPAALRAAARLNAARLLDGYLSHDDRAAFARAGAMADRWAAAAPGFFRVSEGAAAAARNVAAYAAAQGVPADAARAASGAGGARFFALSLDAAGAPVRVMNSDLGFELLFGAPHDTDAMADDVATLMRPFPAGLMTGVGMVVANAAYAPAALQPSFDRSAYHGAVVWSWQQALFAAGLARQLARDDLSPGARQTLAAAQARLWTAIGATARMSNSELWSWIYADGRYQVAPFGASGGDADESNAAQLWSTVYLAVRPPGRG
ncbi:hypothetical protein [uncultured Sphingomonas sp.]|uniref:hypothetical protein n=1 Tax=uncultured Sphingomonas sp. TaxID=158754 RepID=UPI0035C98330